MKMTSKELENIIEHEGNSSEWNYKCKNGMIIPCEIRRNDLLFLCGYVKLDKDNPYYNVDSDDIPCTVHGGVNYTNKEDEFWVIGFDCGHHNDLVPYFILNNMRLNDATYRNMSYVSSECENLAEQLSQLTSVNQF